MHHTSSFLPGWNRKCGALWTLWLSFGKINLTCDGAADVWRTASPSQVRFTCRTEGDDVTGVTRLFNFLVFEQTPVKITLFCFICASFLLLQLFRLTSQSALFIIYLFICVAVIKPRTPANNNKKSPQLLVSLAFITVKVTNKVTRSLTGHVCELQWLWSKPRHTRRINSCSASGSETPLWHHWVMFTAHTRVITSSPADDYRMSRIINTFDQQLLKNDPLNRTSFFLCPAPGGGLWLTESNITEEETWFLSCASELQTSLHLLNSVWLVHRRYRCNWQETQVCFSVISAAGFSRAAHAPEPSAGLCCYLIRSTFLCFTPEHRKWRFKLFQIKTRLTRIYLTNHVSKHQVLLVWFLSG